MRHYDRHRLVNNPQVVGVLVQRAFRMTEVAKGYAILTDAGQGCPTIFSYILLAV